MVIREVINLLVVHYRFVEVKFERSRKFENIYFEIII